MFIKVKIKDLLGNDDLFEFSGKEIFVEKLSNGLFEIDSREFISSEIIEKYIKYYISFEEYDDFVDDYKSQINGKFHIVINENGTTIMTPVEIIPKMNNEIERFNIEKSDKKVKIYKGTPGYFVLFIDPDNIFGNIINYKKTKGNGFKIQLDDMLNRTLNINIGKNNEIKTELLTNSF